MKMKLFICLFTVGMFLIAPSKSYAQITDESLEYLGSNPGEQEWGPVSLYPTLMGGTISQSKGIITNNFWSDLGSVGMRIVNQFGNIVMSKTLIARKGMTDTVDVRWLPAGQYTIMYGNTNVLQKAVFYIR